MNDSHSIERLLAESAWVRVLAGTLVRSNADAEDLAQDTLALALERPPALDRPVRPWLATVARNLQRTRYRGAANRAARERESSGARPSARAPLELLQEVELQEELSALVRELDAPQRDAVLLRYHEGLSAVEIGRQLGVPAATVRSRLMRGLAVLREKLDARWDGDRRAWIAALTPLTRERRAGAAATASSSGSLAVVATIAAATAVAASIGYGALYLGGSGTRDAQAEVQTVASRDTGAAARIIEEPKATVRGVSDTAPERRAVAAPPPESASNRAPVVTAISLRAVDASGAPVSGARVEVLASSALGSGLESQIDSMSVIERAAALATLVASTDSSGRARVWTDLLEAPVRANLRVRGDGHSVAEVSMPIEPGDSKDAGDVTLAMRGRIFGVLRDTSGAPLEGVVWIHSQRGDRTELVATDSTSADGRFEAFVERAGPHTVQGRSRYARDFAAPSPPREIELGADLEFDVRAPRVEPALRVRAVDADGAVLAAEIEYAFTSNGRPAKKGRSQTGRDGSYALNYGGGADQVEIRVTPKNGRYATRTVERLAPFEDVELVFEPFDTEARTLRLAVPGGTKATGTFRTRSFGQYAHHRIKDSIATIEVPRVAGADFGVTIEADGMVHLRLLAADLLERPSESTVELTPLPGVTGVVTGDGQPLARARIRISHRRDPGEWSRSENGVSGVRWGAGHDGRTDREGRFRVPLAYGGRWIVEASARGFAPCLLDLGDFEPERGALDLEIALERPGAVRGVVRDAEGAPEPRGLVVALHAMHRTVRARADRKGAFELELAPGEWTLLTPATEETEAGMSVGLSVPEDWALPGGVHVTSGATTRVDVAPPATELRALPVRVDGNPARGTITFGLAHGDPLLELASQRVELDAEGRAALRVPKARRCELTARLDGVDGFLDRRVRAETMLNAPEWALSTARVTLRGAADRGVGLRIRFGDTTLRSRARLGPEGVSEELTLVPGEVEAFVDGAWVPLGQVGGASTELWLP